MKQLKMISKQGVRLTFAGLMMVSIQGCNPVTFDVKESPSLAAGPGGNTPDSTGINEPGSEAPGGQTPGQGPSGGDPSLPNDTLYPPPPAQPGDTTTAIRLIKPSLAVRGAQCLMCHGKIESNFITDFGLGSPHFGPLPTNEPSFLVNENVYGNGRGSWQTSEINGQVVVPKVRLSTDMARKIFGDSSISSFVDAITKVGLGGIPGAMADAIKAPAGQAAILEKSSIQISYPTENEIKSLVPVQFQSLPKYLGAIANVSNQSFVSGLELDSSQKFFRNTQTVVCRGDVVVKGVLFLENLKLETDSSGCRLYVSQSVFIKGPITYQGAADKQNIQISSARAIIMGFSARRLGAHPSMDGSRVVDHVDMTYDGTPGGAFIRLAKEIDVRYEPGTPQAARGKLSDAIVHDSAQIGSRLVDAADPSYVQAPPPGTYVLANRIAVDYSGVVLNAPHIHSRYGGAVKGVMIADIAVYLLDATQNNAHFVYDPIFDQVPSILPALPRGILKVSAD